MTSRSPLSLAVVTATACLACSAQEPNEAPHSDDAAVAPDGEGRGAIGKADVTGNCAKPGGDFCGGKSDETCWCDGLCTQFGDCCIDYAPVCVGSGGAGGSGGNSPLPCMGVNVPGDYPSLAAALAELGASGGTICVDEGGTHERVDTDVHAPLTIAGVSSGAALDAIASFRVHDATLTIRDMRFSQRTFVTHVGSGNVVLEGNAFEDDLRLRGPATHPPEPTSITVARCDLHKLTVAPQRLDLTLRIHNNFIHDNYWVGMALLAPIFPGEVEYVVTNNTFARNGTGLRVDGLDLRDLVVRNHNNVFFANDIAIDHQGIRANANDVVLVASHNALWANPTNYGGQAQPGANRVTDPLELRFFETPPRPLPGSPLIGAARADVAPATDFHGTPRDAAPDIGAVEH